MQGGRIYYFGTRDKNSLAAESAFVGVVESYISDSMQGNTPGSLTLKVLGKTGVAGNSAVEVYERVITEEDIDETILEQAGVTAAATAAITLALSPFLKPVIAATLVIAVYSALDAEFKTTDTIIATFDDLIGQQVYDLEVLSGGGKIQGGAIYPDGLPDVGTDEQDVRAAVLDLVSKGYVARQNNEFDPAGPSVANDNTPSAVYVTVPLCG